MFSTVSQVNVSRCVAFAPARPTQTTLWFQLTSGMGPASLALVLQLFRSTLLPPIETYKSLHHLPVNPPNAKSYHGIIIELQNFQAVYRNGQRQDLHDLNWYNVTYDVTWATSPYHRIGLLTIPPEGLMCGGFAGVISWELKSSLTGK